MIISILLTLLTFGILSLLENILSVLLRRSVRSIQKNLECSNWSFEKMNERGCKVFRSIEHPERRAIIVTCRFKPHFVVFTDPYGIRSIRIGDYSHHIGNIIYKAFKTTINLRFPNRWDEHIQKLSAAYGYDYNREILLAGKQGSGRHSTLSKYQIALAAYNEKFRSTADLILRCHSTGKITYVKRKPFNRKT
jgi:hypothetical protein